MKELNPEKLAALVQTHAQQELDKNKISIKEIIIHQNGRLVYHELFGAPASDARLLFRAASMTKPVTAAAVLQLVDRGLLDLNEPVSRYYPQMKQTQIAAVEDGKIVSLRPAQNEIRVADLLCHTSGVGCEPVSSALNSTTHLPLSQAVQLIAAQPLAFEPRTAQAYSATDAFDLAAGIVEQVSTLPFDEYLRRHIFEPLGMVDTTFAPNAEQLSRMVPMHDRDEQGHSKTVAMPSDRVFGDFLPERMPAGAGLAVTAEDYIRFADMLCLGGALPDGTRVLSKAAVRSMATPHVPKEIEMGSERWGLGVRIVVDTGYPHGLDVGCFGWSGAYGTHFWVDPVNRLSVVMMKNSLYDGGAGNRTACELELDVVASLE